MTTAGLAVAMKECIADGCRQGKRDCIRPLTCSGAQKLVDESIDGFRLHRLQEFTVYHQPADVARVKSSTPRFPDLPISLIEERSPLANWKFWAALPASVLLWTGLWYGIQWLRA